MKIQNHRKSQLLAGIGLFVIGVALLVILGAFGLFTYILNKNIFLILGIVLVSVSLFLLIKGVQAQYVFYMLIGGLILSVLPFIFKQIGGVTLTSVLP